MRRASPILLLVALLAVLPGSAAARQPVTGTWATVNVCDTAASPDKMGIRGGMAGQPRRTRMFMRFRVQFRDAKGRWKLVKTGADSGWQRVGSGRRGDYDAGWTFTFKPPVSGGAHVLRGVVAFEWRRGGRVVLRDRQLTTAGHPGTAGAEPADFSAETCEIA
jgi:hypothetical protein